METVREVDRDLLFTDATEMKIDTSTFPRQDAGQGTEGFGHRGQAGQRALAELPVPAPR